MCCYGPRRRRRSTTSAKRAAKSAGSCGAIASTRWSTPRTCSARVKASTRAEGTPASSSTPAAPSISRRRLISGSGIGDALRLIHLDHRGDHGIQVAVEHLIEVVGLVPGAVIGYPVLGGVIGTDPFAAVHSAHVGAPRAGGLGPGDAPADAWLP